MITLRTDYPTPIISGSPLGEGRLWIKNDGLSALPYGGNKVRKLERILAEGVGRGTRRILTAGAAGSHHVLTTTLFARDLGLPVAALLWPQPWSEHAERTLRASLAQGLDVLPVSSIAAVAHGFVRKRRRGDLVVPVGGAGLAGTLAHADAVDELVADIRRGALPEPESIVLAVGTGTTAAGILAGLASRGLGSRLVGVLVARNPIAGGIVLGSAARALYAAGRLRDLRKLSGRLVIDAGRVGEGYGHPTAEGRQATEAARELGLVLDDTYTSKAFGRALAEAGIRQFSGNPGVPPLERPRRTLYWHTLSAAPLEPLLPAVREPLPALAAALLVRPQEPASPLRSR